MTLVADLMFVNNIPFLVTLPRGIKSVTAENIKPRTGKQLAKSIKRVMQVYSRGGTIVQTVLMSMEFGKTVSELSGRTVVNTSAAREHVTEIERQIRTTKEHCRAVVSTLQFEIIPKLMVTNIVYFVVLWLNAFSVQNGVFKDHSPSSIVIHTKMNWKRHCKVLFGTYCEVYGEPDPSNDMTP